MKNGKKESYFWTSYSDLMTSLFFIMLVLFVLIIIVLHNYNKRKTEEMEATIARLNQIVQLEEQFEELSKSSALKYDEKKKMFVAKDFEGIEIFFSNQDMIKSDYLPTVDEVGKSIEQLVKNLYQKNPDLNFQLVIEGNAAIPWEQLRNKSYNSDNKDMYVLSYRRALALYMRWQSIGINLRDYNTEIIIAGSGFNGINRDKVEDNNKRFVIQIIPKIKRFEKQNE